ncbi:hypothetical protein KR026_006683, partial [Drosophila bipectinata]
LKSGGKRAVFNAADMTEAICLHTAGPRAYRHLHKKGFPLPCRSTLYNWLARKITPGTLDIVIDLMENEDMPEIDKLCVMCFDEMKGAAASADVVLEPSNYVQVAFVRGLKKSWKHPVFYDFNAAMDVATLHSILMKLHTKGFPVVAIVSDLGPGNQRLWGQLGISETKTWFSHPADEDLKVFVFSDTPHLMKLIRNHYIGSGLNINGKKLTKSTIQQTIRYCAQSDVSILFKVTNSHINVESLAKQKVKLATELFSHTTASCIRLCYELGNIIENPCETADFFDLVNDWFDVFNTKMSKENSIETTQPYGEQLQMQQGILVEMSKIMGSTDRKLPFQKGILVSNVSLDGLHSYLAEKYGLEYILTSRLNLDILKNFFGAMRSKNGQLDHPTPLQFKNRLRKYITGIKNTT